MMEIIRYINRELEIINKLHDSFADVKEIQCEGTLVAKREGSKKIYYVEKSIGSKSSRKREYIRLGEEGSLEVRNYLRARYYLDLKVLLDKNTYLIKRLIKNYQSYSYEDILPKLPKKVAELLKEENLFVERESQKWEAAEYRKNPTEFAAVHRTITGEAVRSKGEALIYNMLYMEGIPFRYEWELPIKVNGFERKYYPDFTIKGKDGEYYYIEYSGMRGDHQYLGRLMDKLRNYYAVGLTPTQNLFLIFDSVNGEVDTRVLYDIIHSVIQPRT